MTFDELLSEVWGPEYVGDNLLVRVAMSRLRAKIEEDTGTPVHHPVGGGVRGFHPGSGAGGADDGLADGQAAGSPGGDVAGDDQL